MLSAKKFGVQNVCLEVCFDRGQKFPSFARNYESNLERMSNSSQSTRPTGRVL